MACSLFVFLHFYQTQVRSLPCLITLSVSRLVEIYSNCLICQSCFMDFSKLSNGFVKTDAWISPSCYIDMSKLINGFLEIFTWICQSCYIH